MTFIIRKKKCYGKFLSSQPKVAKLPFSDRHYLTLSTTLSKTSKDRDQEEERKDDLYYTKME